MMLGTKVLDCHHGKNTKLKKLNKNKKESGWVRASSFFLFIVLKGFTKRSQKHKMTD